jgi:hypothetical protein
VESCANCVGCEAAVWMACWTGAVREVVKKIKS